MKDYSKVLRALIALAVAAGLGTLIGWWAVRQGDVKPVIVTSPTVAPAPPPATAAAPEKPLPPLASRSGIQPATPQIKTVTAPSAGGLADWEQKLDDILLANEDQNTKADKILALLPTAPVENQTELAQHLVNMVADDHYDGTAALLTNTATPPDVSEVLMNDLLNRNNNLKLPMLLAVAEEDGHPQHQQALDLLGLLTQQDDGTNWSQWTTDINTWLQNNQQ